MTGQLGLFPTGELDNPDNIDKVTPRKRPMGSTNHKQSRWDIRSIVAWDGEGYTKEDGTHVYNLLTNSNGDMLADTREYTDGLSTVSCFEFMLSHSKWVDINVIFSGNYDVNMILKDLSKAHVEQLHKNGYVRWGDYGITFRKSKMFSVTKYENGSLKTFTLWDVFGYFQSSFVKACTKWLGDDPVIQEIGRMKAGRNTFRSEDISAIIAYNTQENILLVRLVTKLFDAMDDAGIRLTRYDGAGSIAAALLRSNNVQRAMGEVPAQVTNAGQYAYSGGRIEVVYLGNAEDRPIYRYDINSAYPSEAINLPSYEGARWEWDNYWDGNDYSLVKVYWQLPANLPFYPLYYRHQMLGKIYPRVGMGIYFGCEIRNLEKYFIQRLLHQNSFGEYELDRPGYAIIGAYNCKLGTDEKPFAFLGEAYETRLRFKAEGNMASEAIKLGINSVYGKLAQQLGGTKDKIPTYHQLLWAGQITAATRAKLYDAAMEHPTDVICFATDSITTTKAFESIDAGEGLGKWSEERFDGMTIAQAGVYWLRTGNEWSDKYRGFDPGTLDREAIVKCWTKIEDRVAASMTRFVQMGSALQRPDSFHDRWRKWITEDRYLRPYPQGNRRPLGGRNYWEKLVLTDPAFLPNAIVDDRDMSLKFAVKWLDETDTFTIGQSTWDNIEFNDEYLQSYE